jgi:signal transduction histidine kinase
VAERKRQSPSAEARIAELESELSAATKTIRALLDKAEQRDQALASSIALFEAAARMEQTVALRTREVEEKSLALARANSELLDLTDNLDHIVRQRNRALVESERQLRRKNEELKRLNHMKGEFISIAAHELRTPLTSIVGYLDLMAEGRFGCLPTEVERPISSVRRNAHRLMRLVDEMLDVSRIEAGKIALQRARIDLSVVARDVVSELGPLAATKHQSVSLEYDAPVVVFVDGDKIHQVISNLVANAIRYTPDGGAIRVFVDEPPEQQVAGSWARVRVRDNGIGIPAGELPKIFEPFSDVHSAKHHTSSGPDSAGLGLYIARGLVDLHGGIITVDSAEGAYTEFTVLLPHP